MLARLGFGLLPLRLVRWHSRLKIQKVFLSSFSLISSNEITLITSYFIFFFCVPLHILCEFFSYSCLYKGFPLQPSDSKWWLHWRGIHSRLPQDLGEEHSIGNMILLHLRVEPVLEYLHPVEEDYLKQIYLLTYHDLVHAKTIFITDILSWPYPRHDYV